MPSPVWIVTGGAGYIGAHVVRALQASGRRAMVVDDLSTGSTSRLATSVDVEEISVLDTPALTELVGRVRPTGIVHLAGKKSPTESMTDPLLYARENVGGVISLLEALRTAGGTRVVFSSSCSVYGTPDLDIVGEEAPTLPESPYGESKLYGERVLAAAASAYHLGVMNLRYFNVVGAATPEMRDSGRYNLVPLVLQAVTNGRRPQIYGGDYPTPDGTCIRDYVDVRDVADAHVRAAEALERDLRTATYNVGRGEGSSVLEVLKAVSAVTGHTLEYDVVERRPGDPARIVGRVDRIAQELGWSAHYGLISMIESAWTADPSPPVASAVGLPARFH